MSARTEDPDSKPVLIVGGGGFIGTNFTDALLAAGVPVINLSRTWLVRRDDARVRYVLSDDGDPDQVARLVAGAGQVFHMAHGSSLATGLQAMEDNLTASMRLTFALMTACAAAGVPLIYLSSGGAIYGPDVPVPTPETAPTLPISPYGAEKLTAERYLHIGAVQLGLAYRVLRISNPSGPWQLGLHGQGVIGTWMRRILNGEQIEIWGDGRVIRDYVYIDDLTDALMRVRAYDGAERCFNIGSGEGHKPERYPGADAAGLQRRPGRGGLSRGRAVACAGQPARCRACGARAGLARRDAARGRDAAKLAMDEAPCFQPELIALPWAGAKMGCILHRKLVSLIGQHFNSTQ
ncbi:MAG: NAD-dependent epimerase/dehydratase family protein [Paracoccaceae bacterium]